MDYSAVAFDINFHDTLACRGPRADNGDWPSQLQSNGYAVSRTALEETLAALKLEKAQRNVRKPDAARSAITGDQSPVVHSCSLTSEV